MLLSGAPHGPTSLFIVRVVKTRLPRKVPTLGDAFLVRVPCIYRRLDDRPNRNIRTLRVRVDPLLDLRGHEQVESNLRRASRTAVLGGHVAHTTQSSTSTVGDTRDIPLISPFEEATGGESVG